jgi:hypothetical protein
MVGLLVCSGLLAEFFSSAASPYRFGSIPVDCCIAGVWWVCDLEVQTSFVGSIKSNGLSSFVDPSPAWLCWDCVCRWISCRKNTGYHATDPKIRTQGVEHVRSWIATKHGGGSLETLNAQHTAERDTELYPGSGPSWRGKPLLPTFLYYDAIPHEEYKVLVTEL